MQRDPGNDRDASQRLPLTSPRVLSRRSLLQAAGAASGLMITFSSSIANAAGTRATGPGGSRSQAARPEAPTDLDSYLKINPDGTITALTGKVEFGQGIQTGFGQLIAEELSVPFESVTIIHGITDQVPYDGATAGSADGHRRSRESSRRAG